MPAEDEVEDQGRNGTEEGADEERRSERSAHASGGIRGGHRHHLEEHRGENEEDHHPVDVAESIEERVVEQLLRIAVHERREPLVTFAVERREDEDQHTEHEGARDPLLILPVEALEEEPDLRVDRGEVVGHHSAQTAQQDEHGYLNGLEGVGRLQRNGQNGIEAPQQKSHRRGGDRGDQQRYDRAGREIEHEDFEHEHHTRDRGLEDGGERRAGAAAEQQGGVLVVEACQPGDVRADGGARQHDRSLRSDRTAESDGRGAAHDRGPAVVRGDARSLARHGIQNARYPF